MWGGAFAATHVPMRVFPAAVADLGHVVLHSIGYLGLSSWFILTVEAFGLSRVRQVILVLPVMTIYAAVDEYTQQFFGRSNRWQDWLTDTVATAIALAIWEGVFLLASSRRKTGQAVTEREAKRY